MDACAMSWVLLAVALWLLSAYAGTTRWRLLLRDQGLRPSPGFLFQTWLAGAFWNALLPGMGWGTAYRLAQSARVTREGIRAAAAIVAEKALGLVSLAMVFLVFVPVGVLYLGVHIAKLKLGLVSLGVMCAALAALTLVLRPRIVHVLLAGRTGIAARGASALSAWKGRGASVAEAVSLGVLMQVCRILAIGCVLMALRQARPPSISTALSSALMAFEWVLSPAMREYGIREFVLGETPGFAKVSAWVFRYAPLVLGLPLLVWQMVRIALRKPETVDVESVAADSASPRMTVSEARTYWHGLAGCALAGIAGGLVGGAITGFAEGCWLAGRFVDPEELRLLWWAPLVYGPMMTGYALAAAGACAFFYAAMGRFWKATTTFAISLGATLSASIVIIGRFRFSRDVLGEKELSPSHIATLLALALLAGFVTAGIGPCLLGRFRAARRTGLLSAVSVYAGVVCTGALLAVTWPHPPERLPFDRQSAATGPNVIIIVADTLRADYLRLYSEAAETETPCLDAFARDAILFECCYAQAPWTKPSFGTIFTGLYPSEHGAIGKWSILAQSVVTLPELLYDRGYYTQGFPNNYNIFAPLGFGQGFVDYTSLLPRYPFFGSFSTRVLVLYEVLRAARAKVKSPYINEDEVYQPASAVNLAAAEWLDEQPSGDAPFFLFLHYMDPHDPYMSAEEEGVGYAMLELGMNPDPGQYLDAFVRAYEDEVEVLDAKLGELFDGLRRHGLYEPSVIILTADHGEELYEHQGWWHGTTHYDEVMHVPLLIKLPGGKLGGRANGAFARHLDLAPTILELCGMSVPEAMSGRPLIARDGRFLNDDITHVFAESDFTGAVLQSQRSAGCKAIRANVGNPRGLKQREFYDLAQDPGERYNRSGQGDPREDELKRMMDEALTRLEGRMKDEG